MQQRSGGGRSEYLPFSLPSGRGARLASPDVRPGWQTGRVCRSRRSFCGCCSACVPTQLFLQVAMTRIQPSSSRTNSKCVVPDVFMLRAGRRRRGEWRTNPSALRRCAVALVCHSCVFCLRAST